MDRWQTHERMNQEQKGTKIGEKKGLMAACVLKKYIILTRTATVTAVGLYRIPTYDHVGDLGMIRIFMEKNLRGLRSP